jgi:hypothetical protein
MRVTVATKLMPVADQGFNGVGKSSSDVSGRKERTLHGFLGEKACKQRQTPLDTVVRLSKRGTILFEIDG